MLTTLWSSFVRFKVFRYGGRLFSRVAAFENPFQCLSLIEMTNNLNNHHNNEYRNEEKGQQHEAS